MDGSDDAMVTIYTHTTLHTHGMLADFVPTSFNRNANAAARGPCSSCSSCSCSCVCAFNYERVH